MKKAIALLATLVVLTSSAFAQLAPTISGSAETKWGTNLNDETDGFELSTDVTVEIPLVSEESVATEGEGAYGEASITGSTVTLTLGLDSFNDDDAFLNDDVNSADSALKGTDAEISAKIQFGNGAYATIGSDTGLSANFVEGDEELWVNPDFAENDGISLGYINDSMAFEFTVVNEADGYERDGNDDSVDATFEGKTDFIAEDKQELTGSSDETTTAPTKEDGYFVGATAMYTAGDIFTLDFAFATNSTGSELDDSAKKTGIAVKATSIPMEGLTVVVPFDYLTYSDADAMKSGMELKPDVAFVAGAITLGLDFHYISVVVSDDLTWTGTKLNADVAYALDAGTVKLEVGSNLADNSTTLNADMDAYEANDMDFTAKVSFTAATYNVTADFGNVIHEDGMDDLGFDAGFTGVPGVAATLETTLSLDEDRDNSEAFTLDALNVDLTSELHGVENTTFTVNFSEYDASDAKKGIFYVGAKISL